MNRYDQDPASRDAETAEMRLWWVLLISLTALLMAASGCGGAEKIAEKAADAALAAERAEALNRDLWERYARVKALATKLFALIEQMEAAWEALKRQRGIDRDGLPWCDDGASPSKGGLLHLTCLPCSNGTRPAGGWLITDCIVNRRRGQEKFYGAWAFEARIASMPTKDTGVDAPRVFAQIAPEEALERDLKKARRVADEMKKEMDEIERRIPDAERASREATRQTGDTADSAEAFAKESDWVGTALTVVGSLFGL